MNNSLNIDLSPEFLEETGPDKTKLREREAKLVRMLEALGALSQSTEWSSLKDELFDGLLENIENRMRVESGKSVLDTAELYRLQGERKWAQRYGDPMKLVSEYRQELAHIRKQINPGDLAP